MNTILYIAPIVAVAAAACIAKLTFRKSGSGAKAVKVNFAALALVFCVCIFGSMAVFASPDETAAPATTTAATTDDTADTTTDAAAAAAASGTATAAAASGTATAVGMGLIAAALSTSLSGIGGGIAVASAAPAAIGATSEDPKAFGKAIIFVALGESIALYGLVISIMILSKVPSITDLLLAL